MTFRLFAIFCLAFIISYALASDSSGVSDPCFDAAAKIAATIFKEDGLPIRYIDGKAVGAGNQFLFTAHAVGEESTLNYRIAFTTKKKKDCELLTINRE